ncbi:MAG: flagellar biosynthesis protein FliQ [Armatimonadetes bacterium]|nr:flagellar biosynthesis protein FliQ [Armatimonadota bacterium]
MTDSGVLELGQRAIAITLMICAPTLGVGLIVGLMVSVFQAATQIQEMTLTFVPKIVAVTLALVVCGPWMLKSLVNFTSKLLISLPNLVR